MNDWILIRTSFNDAAINYGVMIYPTYPEPEKLTLPDNYWRLNRRGEVTYTSTIQILCNPKKLFEKTNYAAINL